MTASSGRLILIFVALSAISGAVLDWHYLPDVDRARESVVDLEHATLAGSLVRSLHHWAGHGALGLTLLHLATALLGPSLSRLEWRQWLSGLVALPLLVGLVFSGRILPWDEHSRVALLVAESFLGARPSLPGPHLLQRVLLLHVLGTGLLLACLTLHLPLRRWLGSLGASGERPDPARLGVSSHAVLVAALAVALLVVLSRAAPAPLGSPCGESAGDLQLSAEWYSRWAQVLSVRSTGLARLAMIVLLAIGLATPWLSRRVGTGRTRVIWSVLLLSLALLTVLPLR